MCKAIFSILLKLLKSKKTVQWTPLNRATSGPTLYVSNKRLELRIIRRAYLVKNPNSIERVALISGVLY